MRKNQLGSSGLHVSEIGLGCMSLSDNQNENERLLHEAVDGGINYFDTADLYQFGENERSVGEALRGMREKVIIATKGGNEWGPGIDGWRWNPSKEYIHQACRDSLSRLQVDYIDVYQLHGGTLDDPFDETIEALQELKQEGLIRHIGMSSIRPNVINRFLSEKDIVSNMMQYSILDRRPEELFPALMQHEINVVARGPVAKGLLTSNAYDKIGSDGYLDYSRQQLSETIDSLMNIAEEAGMSLSTLALRYVIDQPAVAVAIQGARTSSQLKANLEAADQAPLSSDIIEAVQKAAPASFYTNHRS
ncbi:aldo/keto reductase [Alkalicoccus urumqiensis]|uniref:Oxidoreductase n=1 Tax=Alkalicoccus urumqiensis TaxID=1548213 RepID=A0A2P6MKF1_ALKUR|nr:aldo/keto reductase [Alkalicoccus urumqiensis]PRO66760.1 oxidoreductase [Alkalicoccus urumqiensis]